MKLDNDAVSPRLPQERLGVLERWYLAQPVARLCAVVVELPKSAPMEAHIRAHGQVVARHPVLSCALTPPAALRWERLPAGTPLDLHASDEQSAWSACARLLHMPFTASQPLHRVRILHGGQTVVAAFHHAIADGMSAAIFARDYLAALQGAALPHPDAEALEPLDARLSLRPQPMPLLRLVARTAWILLRPAPFVGPERAKKDLTTELYPWHITGSQVESLNAQCRAQGTTIHGALCAAALGAALHGAGRDAMPARLASPVSLRAASTPEPRGMGVFLCSVDSHHNLNRGMRFWDLARDCQRAVLRGKPQAMTELGLLKRRRDLTSLAQHKGSLHAHGRTATVEVSNLGRQTIGEARTWFAQGNHYHGPLYSLSVLTDQEKGDMTITLAVPAPLLSGPEARAFLARLDETLRRAARNPRADLS